MSRRASIRGNHVQAIGWAPNPPRRKNACPDRFEFPCAARGVTSNQEDGQPCGYCGDAYCHACYGTGEWCARCERRLARRQNPPRGDEDIRALERAALQGGEAESQRYAAALYRTGKQKVEVRWPIPGAGDGAPTGKEPGRIAYTQYFAAKHQGQQAGWILFSNQGQGAWSNPFPTLSDALEAAYHVVIRGGHLMLVNPRRSNPDDELSADFRAWRATRDPAALERVRAGRRRAGLKQSPDIARPWDVMETTIAQWGGMPKNMTVSAATNLIKGWLGAQGWHADFGGGRMRSTSAVDKVWISPDEQRRVTFGAKSMKFEVGGRGRWRRDTYFESALGKDPHGELNIRQTALVLYRHAKQQAEVGWTDARQNPPCTCGRTDGYVDLRGRWSCKCGGGARATGATGGVRAMGGTVCPGCGQVITWGLPGAPHSGNQFTECGGEGNGVCVWAGFADAADRYGRAAAIDEWKADGYDQDFGAPPDDAQCDRIMRAHTDVAKKHGAQIVSEKYANPPLAVLGMGPLPAGLLNPGGPGEEGAGPKGFKPKFSEGDVDLEEARALLPEQVAAAEERLRMFHEKNPAKKLLAISYDDGKPEHTYKVVVGLGKVPETHYVTPWPSNKKGYHWVHQHPEGREPIEVLDPETGTTSKIGGTARVTDWWRK